MEITFATQTYFEKLRDADRIKADSLWVVDEMTGGKYSESYGYSPDGEGFFWYDTMEEMLEAHPAE